jgi:hypothetical protein
MMVRFAVMARAEPKCTGAESITVQREAVG